MDAKISIDRLAVHYVNKKSSVIELADSEQDVTELDPLVVEFLLRLVKDVWDAEDKGKINSAKFSSNEKGQLTKEHIDLIIEKPECFYDSSVELARHLFSITPTTASPGLLGVLRLKLTSDPKVYVALLKIQVKSEKFVRLRRTTLTQITVEDVENLLMEKIQKGAIHPHPLKKTYDLKVIDKQSSEDPAKYFSEFLGCESKISDEHQVKKLIPELESFARKSGLPFASEKVPTLIQTMKSQRRNVTSYSLAALAEQEKLFGDGYMIEDLIDYFQEESDLGDIDIPFSVLEKRGSGKRSISRKLKLTFSEKQYYGIEISGPVEMISEIMSVDGDTITITLETTRDGITSTWE